MGRASYNGSNHPERRRFHPKSDAEGHRIKLLEERLNPAWIQRMSETPANPRGGRPQPSGASTSIRLQPGPAGVGPRGPVSPSHAAQPGVRVHHEGAGAGPGPSSLRLLLGFVVVVGAAALVGFVKPTQVRDVIHELGQRKGAAAIRAAETAEGQSDWWEGKWGQYAYPGLGGLLIAVGAVSLKRRWLHFLATGILVAGTVCCVGIMLRRPVSWPWLLLMGAGLSYLIQSGSKPVVLSVRGFIGWALIAFAGVACVEDWLNVSAVADGLGKSAGDFLGEHELEVGWFAVLVLVAIGVACSKSRGIHFFDAILLVALAYFCFQDGYVKTVDFSHLWADVKPVEKADIGNIELWRWVFMGTLIIISAMLLHFSLGVGALTIAFAIVWLLAGLHADRYFGRLAFVRIGSPGLAGALAADGGERGNSREMESMPSPAGRGYGEPETLGRGELQLERKDLVALVVPLVWTYLTAALAGLLGAAGLRLLLSRPESRWWVVLPLWFGFGIALTWLVISWPRIPGQSLDAWLRGLGMVKEHRHAIGLMALGVMALAGARALHRDSRYETWLYVAVSSIFIGTAISLIGLAVLIYYGGYDPLPVWSYISVAVGQSSMMWVLLMHLNLRSRSATAEYVQHQLSQRL